MSIAHEFEYAKPVRLKEALSLLARPVPGGAIPLAGGTDLVAWLRDGAVSPGRLVDVKGLDELRGISASLRTAAKRSSIGASLFEINSFNFIRLAPRLLLSLRRLLFLFTALTFAMCFSLPYY